MESRERGRMVQVSDGVGTALGSVDSDGLSEGCPEHTLSDVRERVHETAWEKNLLGQGSTSAKSMR